jgi:FkbM family methyltransferase
MGLHRWGPNYALLPVIARDARVVDVGVGDNPDFAEELARAFGARCLLVDPTRKHSSRLRAWCDLARSSEYLCAALGATSGRTRFFESRKDVSGSVFTTHRNIAAGDVDAYEVPVVTLDELVSRAGGRIDVLKIDVEGAEFEVLERAPAHALERIGQILVEFHDGTVPEFTRRHRDAAVLRLRANGFRPIEYNGRDVLFVRSEAARERLA